MPSTVIEYSCRVIMRSIPKEPKRVNWLNTSMNYQIEPLKEDSKVKNKIIYRIKTMDPERVTIFES